MRTVDIAVRGDADAARQAAVKALEARKFRVAWADDWTAVAERGNKVANALLGAFAQYFKVGVRLMAGNPGETVVRFERQSSGAMGGAAGAVRTNRNMQALRDALAQEFQAQGILVGVSEVR